MKLTEQLFCPAEAFDGISQRAVFQAAGSRIPRAVDGVEDILVVQLPLPQLVAPGVSRGMEVGDGIQILRDRGENVPLGDLLVVNVVDV